MLSIVHVQLANSGGGVEDDGLNFRITSCGISLSFGSCRLYKNFATAILFQMTSPMTIPINTTSCIINNTIGVAIAAVTCDLPVCDGQQFEQKSEPI